MLIGEEHGGAGLGTFDALLVAEECGRVLASVPLLGLLPASAILERGRATSRCRPIAAGELRPAYVPARPPERARAAWTVDPSSGMSRVPAPRGAVSDGSDVVLEGEAAFVPDAPGAELLVASASPATGSGGGGDRGSADGVTDRSR